MISIEFTCLSTRKNDDVDDNELKRKWNKAKYDQRYINSF